MFHDIKACIEGRANFAAALVLSSYTETLGGLVRGDITNPDQGKKNYVKFLTRMGYTEKDARRYYGIVRSNLVHGYFISGEFTIARYAIPKPKRGIVEQNGRLFFFMEAYFNEFKGAYYSYKRDLRKGVGDLQRNFDLALGGKNLAYSVRSVYDTEIPKVAWPPVGISSASTTAIFVPVMGPLPQIIMPDNEPVDSETKSDDSQ